MKIEDRPIESLIPYARNPRRNDEAVAGVAASIKEFGFKQPIVVDANSVVVAGHTRVKAAQKLGLKFVPVVVADDLTPQQVKAFRILDNKVAEKAEWDDELLALELQEIDLDLEEFDVDFDGVDDGPIDTTDDEVPEVDKGPAITQPGDLWLLGEHRVLCGDSTSEANLINLIQSKQINIVWTDPPYGVDHKGGTKDPRRATFRTGGEITNDNLNETDLDALLVAALSGAHRFSKPGAAIYVACPAGTPLPLFIAAVAQSGFTFKHSLVWVKHAFVFGRADYHYRHEIILYGWDEGAAHYFTDDRKQDTVLEYDRGDKTIAHPTSKPIGLVVKLIGNSSRKGELVYDPFLGSGTTLIAAHRLGRTCYGIEISPQYCDVICKRFYAETGIIPVKESGEQFPVDDRTENTET